MKISITYKKLFFFVLLSVLVSQKSFSQCFQIESILVDACSNTDEGKNEMVRFKIGTTAQNVINLSVTWPNNTWQGLIQDAGTAAKVLLINQNIDDAGGCGNILEPVGGVLPANAKVILVTSQLFDVAANPFGALTENTYILFQDNLTTTAGHFANFNSTVSGASRTLTINFGGCNDAVTYKRNLLTTQTGAVGAQDGATVNFTDAGVATYVNTGCAAPVLVSTVDAGSPTINACVGGTILLNGIATGQTSVTWSAPSGTFTNPNSLATDYQIAAPAGTTVVLTLTAYNGLCEITDTITLTINPFITPDFATTLTVCNGASPPALINTSLNGINGTWTPAVINNTIGGTYNFVPTAGQCANPTQLVVTIDNSCAFGSFASAVKLKKSVNCITQTDEFYNTSGSGVNLIAPIANEFNNSFLGVYQQNSANLILKGGQIKTFKSTGANVCGVKLKYRVYLTSTIGTTFSQIDCLIYDNCVGGSFPTLGPCNPGDQKWQEIGNNLDMTTYTPGNYTIELFYEINGDNNSISACNDTQIVNNGGVNFKANFTIQKTAIYTGNNPTTCNGNEGTITIAGLSPNTNYNLTYNIGLSTVGPNILTTDSFGNILVSGLTIGSYSNFNLNINGCNYPNFIPIVLINPVFTPTFSQVSAICSGATVNLLPTPSLEGITGTWSPTFNNTITTLYTFTPTTGQCATTASMTITVNPNVMPTFTEVSAICSGATLATLPTTSTNGIAGTWSPALNNTATTTYTFTPTIGQCVTTASLTITVNPNIMPTFTQVSTICSGETLSALPTTSTNGITGTWSPTLSNTATALYTFTPTIGQCATTAPMTITVNPNVTPTFTQVNAICSGATLAALSTTSINGIIGTWLPALNNAATTLYTFTPTTGQCATTALMTISVNPNLTPTFTAVAPICVGETLSTLSTTSLEGITGTWSPALNNNATTNYVFTSDTGQCALNGNLTITVNPSFDFAVRNDCFNGDYTLIAEPVSSSFDPTLADYKWKDASGNTVGSNEATLNVTSLLNMTPNVETFPITYFITITSKDGCEKTNTGFVVNEIICKIPKGISPGVVDGKNDTFDLTGFNVEKIEIFNRYGTEVFSWGAYTNQWHGQSSGGEDLPDGTYFYVINRKGGITTTGWIYINRQY